MFFGGFFGFFCLFFFGGGGAGSVAHCIDLQQWCLTVVKEHRKNTFVRTQKKNRTLRVRKGRSNSSD